MINQGSNESLHFPKTTIENWYEDTFFEDQAMVVMNKTRGSRNFHVIFVSFLQSSVVAYITVYLGHK